MFDINDAYLKTRSLTITNAQVAQAVLARETRGAFLKAFPVDNDISRLAVSIIVIWLRVTKPGAAPLQDLVLAIIDLDSRPTISSGDEYDPRAYRDCQAVKLAIQDGPLGGWEPSRCCRRRTRRCSPRDATGTRWTHSRRGTPTACT